MVWLAAAVGLAVSVGLEQCLHPRPHLMRPWTAWALHGGLWLLAFAVVTLATARPWFAAVSVAAFLLTLVLVSNAKYRALREPFVFQDYEYFTDAIRHPRLYIPFLGWGKFVLAVLGFVLAVTLGFLGESVPAERFAVTGQLGGIVPMLLAGAFLVVAGSRQPIAVSFDPERDLVALGLLASLWRYAEAEGQRPAVASPFDALAPKVDTGELPHLVAIQSESFFDPRPLFAGIRRDVLEQFDRTRAEAVLHGPLKVPAWGANTVRTEFAFLTGIDADGLEVHRFNPYRAVATGWDVPSLASFLKCLGYRTVCVHPYPASFYRRDRVYPRLGFDEFLDIRAFAGAERFGPYVSDAAVADKIAAILAQATGPVFVFAITMENHGPLHLEKINPGDTAALYTGPPPASCDDLTIFLRHLRNADGMIATLRRQLAQCRRPAGLCWFGDHVPIMPAVYGALGAPAGTTEFLFWSNRTGRATKEKPLAAHQLAALWLRSMGLVRDASFAGRPPRPCRCQGPRRCGSQSGQRPSAEAMARTVRQ